MFVILRVTGSCSAMHLLKTGFQAHDNWKEKKREEKRKKKKKKKKKIQPKTCHARQLHSPSPGMNGSSLFRKAEMRLLESAKASSNTFTCSSFILFPISWHKPLEERGTDHDHSSARPGWEPGMTLHNLDKHFFPRLHGACLPWEKALQSCYTPYLAKRPWKRDYVFTLFPKLL